MFYGFTNPITPKYGDTPYVAYPAKVFIGTGTYTSECARSFQLPAITETAEDFSFVSQAEANVNALAKARTKALQLRAINPCPN